MNRIVLIGNGFDLAHGLPTKYENFINWYWEQRVNSFAGNLTSISEDCLCSIKITSDNDNRCWNVFAFCLPKFTAALYTAHPFLVQNNMRTHNIP